MTDDEHDYVEEARASMRHAYDETNGEMAREHLRFAQSEALVAIAENTAAIRDALLEKVPAA